MFSVKDVYKGYRGQAVLKGVGLEVSPGELIGVAGRNGSGKSTLLSIMAGLLAPDSGCVTLDGCDVFRKASARRRLGLVPQESALFDELSVRGNINFWSAAYGVKYAPRFFEKNDLRKKARELSGGMRKRLNIELALVGAPDYLVMDEPNSALDLVYQLEVMRIIEKLKAEGCGIIITSHSADELWECDRIHVLSSGIFVYEGSPRGFAPKEDFRSRLYEVISE